MGMVIGVRVMVLDELQIVGKSVIESLNSQQPLYHQDHETLDWNCQKHYDQMMVMVMGMV